MAGDKDSFYQSEDFQAYFNLSPRSLILKANPPRFTILAVSNAYLILVHKERSDLLNEGLFHVFPGSQADGTERSNVAASFSRVMQTKSADVLPTFKYEIYLPKEEKHVTEYWSNINEPLLDEEGNVAFIINTTANITDQVNMLEEKASLELSLRKSQRELQSILDTLAEGVGVVDSSGQLVYANAMAQRILGLTESEIKNRTYHDPKWQNQRIDGSPLPQNEHPMAVMMSTGVAIYDFELGVKPPDRDVFYIAVNASPIFDEGKVIGGVGTFMNVTQRRKVSDQKDEFISVASHELKTPLTALKVSVQLLDSLKNETDVHPLLPRLISQTVSSVDKLEELVNNLLDVNKINRGHLHLSKTRFVIGDMITNCCQYINLSDTHEISFEGNLTQQVCADEQRIIQVLTNFITNAIKYAHSSKKIIVSVKTMTGVVKISVTDFGPGISKDKVDHLFQRYYRADYSIGQGGGLGLGLFISSQIIKSHNGEIGVVSEEGKGSTFWFTLPLTGEC